MTVDICSTSEPFTSPRISFSYDLNNQSFEIATTITTNAPNTTTFDFHVTTNIVQQVTSADELFFEGVLLPTQIKKPETKCTKPNIVVLENKAVDVKKKRLKELLCDNNDEEHEKSASKSFWRFTRTTSLNSDRASGPKKLFRSLSLKRLLHYNTTVVEKSNSHKDVTMLPRCASITQTSPVQHNSSRRLVTKKKSDNGVKINPVLNIPSANINLLGYGSLFCKGRLKNKTK
ncbi:hypothetical protein Tco_0184116 [Tanacetum coccineum]